MSPPSNGPPLKIALIYDLIYPWTKGGGEKTLFELALQLRDRGHEIHMFGMHCWDGPADMERDGLHYHALCPNIPPYNNARRRSIWQAIRFALGLFFNLPRHRLRQFDVIDIHVFPFFSIPAFWLIRRLFARKTAWLVTWLEVWGRDYWLRYMGWKGLAGATLERLCAALGPAHLCISPTTSKRLAQLLGTPEERIVTIPRGFELPDTPLARHTKEVCEAIAVGRLVDYKRVDLLVRAWPIVLAELPNAVLHIVGDGPERNGLEKLATDVGIAGAVRFHGELPNRHDVLHKIASAGLLLQPSMREGQSIVVLEAMALGTAVLAANGPETAVADFLEFGDNTQWSLLDVDAGPDAWAERIVWLMSDPERLECLTLAGQEKACSLGWRDAIAPRVEKLYRVLSGKLHCTAQLSPKASSLGSLSRIHQKAPIL